MEIQKDITAEVLAQAATKATGNDMKRISAGATLGLMRLVMVFDECYDFDTLCGDVYNPQVNTNIDVTTLNRQKRAFLSRVNREGVHTVVLQCRPVPNAEWVNVEFSGSYVGEDFIGSGYEFDMLANANDWLFENLDLPNIQAALTDLL